MTKREVIRMGHPNLRKQADPYPPEEIDSLEFRSLVNDMRETLHAYGGIGLAAPQIDIPYQLIVIEITDSRSRYGDIPLIPFGVYVNPRSTILDDAVAGYWEGCLSIPGIMGYVERPQHLRVAHLDANAQQSSLEVSGFLATVFQHELDHLKGRLFLDRVEDTTMISFDDEYHTFHTPDTDD